MHARFVAAVVTGLAGGFVVTASQAFVSGTTAWLAFAIGIGLLVLTAVPIFFGDRTVAGLAVDAVSGLLAVWTIVASVVFSGQVVRWLSFAEGAGFVLLALLGLTINQVRLTRRAHVATPVQGRSRGGQDAESSRPAAVAA
jgi:hypothetical protein